MSRSYRKPYVVDGYGSVWKKWRKRTASKAVRKHRGVSDGKWYRKIYDSWNIVDFCWLATGKNAKKYSRK